MSKINKINKEVAGEVIKDLSLAYVYSLYRNGLVAEDEYTNLKDDIFDAWDFGMWEDLDGFANKLIANLNSLKDSISEGMND